MMGDGLSFPVSEAVTGELHRGGQRVEASRVAGDDAGVHFRLVDRDSGVMSPSESGEVHHHGSPASSMV